MLRILAGLALLFAIVLAEEEKPADYSGHKVITVTPKSQDDLDFLVKLRDEYGVDLWNEPKSVDIPVMMRLTPGLYRMVSKALSQKGIEYFVAFYDLQSTILQEKILHAPTNISRAVGFFDFGKYNTYDDILAFLNDLVKTYPNLAKLEKVGTSYENRPIYVVKVTSGASGTKPAVLMEGGIHAREWSSVAAVVYFLNELVTKYGSDSEITALVDQLEFYIVPEANPDGYIYTWTHDRMWRKTRSRSSIDWMGNCRGADANRNWDIEHCGIGTSRRPCDEIYCGDAPFSESETRAMRDLMVSIGQSRMKIYFTVHAFSQLWMTPYGTTKSLPPDYDNLVRVGNAGADALFKSNGTRFRVGSIANIIYVATGSSVDYAYTKLGMKMAFALELRDRGRFGFFLPKEQILPTCKETFDGIVAAIKAV